MKRTYQPHNRKRANKQKSVETKSEQTQKPTAHPLELYHIYTFDNI